MSGKSIDLNPDARDFYHRLDSRVKGHVLLCLLAYYVEWHMRRALAPILFDDDDREAAQAARRSVVAPAVRSPRAQRKAQTKHTAEGQPVHSFQTLLKDLATIAKNTIACKRPTFQTFTVPTPLQQRALDLLSIALK